MKKIVTVAKSTPDLPRKSEGDVIELRDGRLLLIYMEFSGDGSDEAETRIVSQESGDGGLTWGRYRIIAETTPGDVNVYSPNLIRAADGGILLIFTRQHNTRPLTSTIHSWKSSDEGETFSPWSEFTDRFEMVVEGDLSISGEWTVFGVFPKSEQPSLIPPLTDIPKELELAGRKQSARKLKVNAGLIDFAWVFDEIMQVGQSAFVYIPVELTHPQQVMLGFGADWWMQVWVNGESVLDTMDRGNEKHPPSIDDHVCNVALRAGTNLIVIRFVCGQASSKLFVGGPAELRQQALACRGYYNLCNAVVKRLTSGRLLLPTVAPSAVLYSDDGGRTWQPSGERIFLPMRGAGEPHVEETRDGRVLMVMRNELGSLFMSESADEGMTWSKPQTTGLRTPESCPELSRIPGTGDLLMIWNNSDYDPGFFSHYGKRSPLTAAVSCDEGRTWEHVRDIEDDPSHAFSNPGCRFITAGKAVLNYWTCEYLPNWAMQDIIELRVAVIDTDWFYER